MFHFINFVRPFVNYAIFRELCDPMRFEVDCAKSHHRVISEGLSIEVSRLKLGIGLRIVSPLFKQTRRSIKAYTGLVRVTQKQKALNWVVLNCRVPVNFWGLQYAHAYRPLSQRQILIVSQWVCHFEDEMKRD